MRPILVILALVALTCALGAPANARVDVAGGRVIHAETVGETPAPTTVTFFINPGVSPAPTVYYVFTTSNQTFINFLNAAQAGNLRVRVVGSGTGSGTTFKAGGTVLRVFRDLIS